MAAKGKGEGGGGEGERGGGVGEIMGEGVAGTE